MESIARNQATAAQIQHLEDAALNPLTATAWPPGHDDLLQARRRLPVYGRYQEILDTYHQSQVMLLSSETGAGKSTQVPQLLVYDEYASGLQIACTQPRRLAAKELANRVADEMGVALGEEVGYKVRNDQRVSKKTRLTYLTEGVLLRQLSSDKNLSAYSCVIIDEAHERTIDLDLLLSLLKKVIKRRKDFKLVIMSATMDAKLFQEYFDNCPLVHIEGRNFEVKIYYTVTSGSSLVHLAAGYALEVHQNEKPGDILVFLPGEDEIGQVCSLLREYATGLDVFPLYSALPARDQKLALSSTGPNRKCIVATNIAETSLTIDNVVYVVDSGLSRQSIYNPRLRLQMLEIRPISQASAKQRAGRAGRTRDGVCYRLYSKEDYDRLAPSTEPAIRCGPVHSVILRLLTSGFKRVIDFDWIDAPHPESIARAAQDLRDWGFLKSNGICTASAHVAAQAPLDPIWWRAITTSIDFGCTMNIVEIALLCSSQLPIFLRPAGYRQVADLARTAFMDSLSDHITLSNAFNAYMCVRQIHQQEDGPNFSLNEWCLEHALNIRALEEVRIARVSLIAFLDDFNRRAGRIRYPSTRAPVTDMTSVRKTLAIAFCTHTAIHHSGDTYRTVHENTPALLAPLSSLVDANHEWVVYTDFVTTGGKQYLQTVSEINAEWLTELPFFQADRLAKKWDGSLRQPNVESSLNDAKARIEAAKN